MLRSRWLAVFAVLLLLCLPVSANLWSFMFRPRMSFYPADINGGSYWLEYLQVNLLDANTVVSRYDVNVVHDTNIHGDLNVAGNLSVDGNVFANQTLRTKRLCSQDANCETGELNPLGSSIEQGIAFGYQSSIGYLGIAAIGYNVKALGMDAIATGEDTIASGDDSFTAGFETLASGDQSVAMGGNTTASGQFSLAAGYYSIASGYGSLAVGSITSGPATITAEGKGSIALGYADTNHFAGQTGSIVMGSDNKSTATQAIAIGTDSTAEGENSVVIGDTVASTTAASDSVTIGKDITNYKPDTVLFGSDVNIIGDVNIEGSLTTSAPIFGGSPVRFISDINAKGDLNVENNVKIYGDLNVVGTTNLKGGVILGSDSNFTNVGISSGLYANDANFAGDVNVANDLEVVGNQFVKGDLFTESDLSVTGESVFHSDINLGLNDIKWAGTINFEGDLQGWSEPFQMKIGAGLTGFQLYTTENRTVLDFVPAIDGGGATDYDLGSWDRRFSNLILAKNLHVVGDINASGDANFIDTATVTGPLFASDINTSSDINVGGSLHVTGNLFTESDLSIAGTTLGVDSNFTNVGLSGNLFDENVSISGSGLGVNQAPRYPLDIAGTASDARLLEMLQDKDITGNSQSFSADATYLAFRFVGEVAPDNTTSARSATGMNFNLQNYKKLVSAGGTMSNYGADMKLSAFGEHAGKTTAFLESNYGFSGTVTDNRTITMGASTLGPLVYNYGTYGKVLVQTEYDSDGNTLTQNNYGGYFVVDSTSAEEGLGTFDMANYGLYIDIDANTGAKDGSMDNYGLYIDMGAKADKHYGIFVAGTDTVTYTQGDFNVMGDSNFTDVGISGILFGDNTNGDLNLGTDLYTDYTLIASKYKGRDANSVTGKGATAFGKRTTAFGDYSFAAGDNTTADGDFGIALGQLTRAGQSSVAMGRAATTAEFGEVYADLGGIAIGASFSVGATGGAIVEATQTGAVAMGYASAFNSVGRIASTAYGSFAAGRTSTGNASIEATGDGAIALGYTDANIVSSGQGSIAMGYNVKSLADAAVTLGGNLTNYDINTVLVNDLNVQGDVNITGRLASDNDCGIPSGTFSFERAAAVSNQAMASGNGDVLQGDPQACAGTVTAIAGSCENCSAGVNEIAMELRINGASQTCDVPQLTTAYDVDSATCDVAFSKHDMVGCYLKTETGAVTGVRCTIYVRYD